MLVFLKKKKIWLSKDWIFQFININRLSSSLDYINSSKNIKLSDKSIFIKYKNNSMFYKVCLIYIYKSTKIKVN